MKKQFYVSDIKNLGVGTSVTLLGWIVSKRTSKRTEFFDICDSTGCIQVVSNLTGITAKLKAEQSVKVVGTVSVNPNNGSKELEATDMVLLGDVSRNLSPSPRSSFDVFGSKHTDYVQENRHLFIRNPKVMAALKARHLVLGAVHNWFRSNGYFDITAPIITPILLYSEDTGIAVNVNDQDLFLTQCVGFYLESVVHALEKVYNVGPSFRGAESVSKRHLTEYWHIKAELAFCEFEDFFSVVESLVSSVIREVEPFSEEICQQLGTGGFCNDGKYPPFPRITYREAIKLLNSNGISVEFGKSINDIAEDFLANYFKSPVWITENARAIEGFPYKILESDPEVTYTADLIATRGFGEILGIADKITDVSELEARLKEKGKDLNPKYSWFKELRTYGTVPHCGLGMGVERLIRWLFQLPHVREAMPFPRSMGRKIYP
ncbi:MAG: asparagine--tRNA ligase [Oscillospiraceae bacterium]|nr:asparagine--tRNA ligase [Oscillospiraceae bacterium]